MVVVEVEFSRTKGFLFLAKRMFCFLFNHPFRSLSKLLKIKVCPFETFSSHKKLFLYKKTIKIEFKKRQQKQAHQHDTFKLKMHWQLQANDQASFHRVCICLFQLIKNKLFSMAIWTPLLYWMAINAASVRSEVAAFSTRGCCAGLRAETWPAAALVAKQARAACIKIKLRRKTLVWCGAVGGLTGARPKTQAMLHHSGSNIP